MSETSSAISVPSGATLARHEFGAKQVAVQTETAAQVMAAQAQAAVQARYIVALQRPRDWDEVRARIMREVERPGFADVAWFRKPIGTGVEGLSVRFAEAAARCMGNLLQEAPVIYEDDQKRTYRVSCTDLESNVTTFRDVTVMKTVERRALTDGRIAISVRTNSKGEATYTVPATEDELLGKEAAITSKVRRNLILQILPGDIQDAAKTRILAIRKGDIAKDPDSAKRKVLDSFGTLNVSPSMLKEYLGHDVSTCSPSELQDLRDLYSTLVDGSTSWAEVMTEKRSHAEPPKPGIDGLKERLREDK